MAKKQEQSWLDETNELNSWDQVIDAYKVINRINASLHKLLIHHKVPAKDVANAVYQAQAEYYGWKKEVKYQPVLVSSKTEVKEVKIKTKLVKSKSKKKVKKSPKK